MTDWWPDPKEYTPGIDKNKWRELLQNPEIFDTSSLERMKRLLDFGGAATCKQLSEKYGETIPFYNFGSVALAKKIYKKTNCRRPPLKNNTNARWWPILYLGKWADKSTSGTYIWCLRPELREALEELDLSHISLYSQIDTDETKKTNEKQLMNNKLDKAEINQKQYWVCWPGHDQYWQEVFVPENILCISVDELEDFTAFSSSEAIFEAINQINISILWKFAHEIAIGDIIIARRGTDYILGKGIVTSDYIFDYTEKKYKHKRKVKWINKGRWKLNSHARGFLADITERKEFIKKLNVILNEDNLSVNNFSLTDDKSDTIARCWLYEPPLSQNERVWDEFTEEGMMYVPSNIPYYDNFGDLTWFDTIETINFLILPGYNNWLTSITSSIWQFVHEMSIGDIVFVRKGSSHIVAKGILDSDYIFDDSRNEYKHIHNIIWTHKGNWRHNCHNYNHIIEISSHKEYIDKLESLVSNGKLLNQIEDSFIQHPIENKRYWLYYPEFEKNGKKGNWEDCFNSGIITLSNQLDKFINITDFTSINILEIQLKEFYNNPEHLSDNENEFNNNSIITNENENHIWQFTNKMNNGDVVFIRYGNGDILGRGIVDSDYIFDGTKTEFKHFRKMKWTHTGHWKHSAKHSGIFSRWRGIENVTHHNEAIAQLEALILRDASSLNLSKFIDGLGQFGAFSYNWSEINLSDPQNSFTSLDGVPNKYTELDFLNQVYLSKQRYTRLIALLQHKKNLILKGAPGTGKTFAAKRLAYSIMGEEDNNRVKTIQFHQNYNYEDFIMGYRPDGTNFSLQYGPFYKFCKIAEEDPTREYFFIIDEINRGNLSKIFGELLMLIEADKRGPGNSIHLMYEKDERFSVPANLYIIGMMNTADRSLAMIDYALRRRFAFFDMEPAFQSDGFKKYQLSKQNLKFDSLIATLEALNEEIANDESLGIGFRIGHSYLVTSQSIDDAWLSMIVEHELIPLIDEYWFDVPSKVDHWSNELRRTLNV